MGDLATFVTFGPCQLLAAGSQMLTIRWTTENIKNSCKFFVARATERLLASIKRGVL